jgi:hypothetical protein
MTDRSTDPGDATDATPTTRFDAREPEPTQAPAPPAAGDDPDLATALTPLDAPPTPPPLAVPPPPPVTPQPAPSSSQPWPPPSWRRRADDPGRLGTVVLGVILLAIGLWFFADQTLELDMPNLRWSQLWPILIIGFGAWIAIGSMRRR